MRGITSRNEGGMWSSHWRCGVGGGGGEGGGGKRGEERAGGEEWGGKSGEGRAGREERGEKSGWEGRVGTEEWEVGREEWGGRVGREEWGKVVAHLHVVSWQRFRQHQLLQMSHARQLIIGSLIR